MKHRKETGEIVARVTGLAASGRRAAVATAVRIDGSAYRRAGAKFLIEDDGTTLGGVSGGCLEADVRVIARDVMRGGAPRLVHYDTGGDDRSVWGLGLGCNGSVDVFVQCATEPPASDTLHAVHLLLDHGAEPFAIATIVDPADAAGRSMIVDESGSLTGSTGSAELDRDVARRALACLHDGVSRLEDVGGCRVFCDIVAAPPRLVVCGAGDDARPLVSYAADVGFAVTVVDHREAFLSADRFPSARRVVHLRPDDADVSTLGVNEDTFVVVKMHSFAHDREWVGAARRAGAAYVGLLGPRARREAIVAELGIDGERLFGPIGLDIGADGPEQIAISIVAELLAVRAARAGTPLRRKAETIHVG
jgi:xanthine dehydrogenase accessory factor